ncbi:MAG: hypothetical protein WEE50_07595 [Chloroflexota bacterium]
MTHRQVTVRILHPESGPAAGPIERWLAAARATLAERHRIAFLDAGAADVAILRGPPDDTPFGARLRRIIEGDRPAGLVILGSGALPLALDRDYRDLVTSAATDDRVALANNRFSADVVAIACVESLPRVPDLPGDNALPRWLDEVAGYRVSDLRARWRLAVDIDGPLDLLLLGYPGEPDDVDLAVVRPRIAAVRAAAADRRGELVVTGRVSAGSLAWLERHVPARVRAIIEERGLRAATRLAQGDDSGTTQAGRRLPASILGIHLDQSGPEAVGELLARLGEAAVVDSRVLLAHRLGTDEASWPPPADRYASDLLLADRIRDPWMRALTEAARAAPIPVLLGGHSLVGPGIRLLLGPDRTRRTSWT